MFTRTWDSVSSPPVATGQCSATPTTHTPPSKWIPRAGATGLSCLVWRRLRSVTLSPVVFSTRCSSYQRRAETQNAYLCVSRSLQAQLRSLQAIFPGVLPSRADSRQSHWQVGGGCRLSLLRRATTCSASAPSSAVAARRSDSSPLSRPSSLTS